jgi:hypothetical protein
MKAIQGACGLRLQRSGQGGESNGVYFTGLPEFVRDEFEAFLECGILAHGFLRVRCADCAHEKLVALSCIYRIGLGPRAGQKVLSLRPVLGRGKTATARLLKRVFDLDLEHCSQCGGDMKIIAAIQEPEVIARILMHLRLPARAPPRYPARRPALFQAT